MQRKVKKTRTKMILSKELKRKITGVELDAYRAELCKRSFYHFVLQFWGVIIQEELVDNWHIKYLCDELQIMAYPIKNREAKLYDLIINIPPGSSKSTIATVMFPVWIWLIDPTVRTITASYSGALSIEHTIKSRDIIQDDRFKKMFKVRLRRDIAGKSHYKNTDGGERYATSVGGTVTGMHAHLLIVDDPLNPKEALSEVERLNANNFMSATLATRKVNKEMTPTILIMQRLHEDDPTGMLLKQLKKGKKIKHICLPAELSDEVNPPELKENYINGLLDPVRMSATVLADMKISLGSYNYAGQMGQTPAPADGGLWKVGFFNVYKELPKEQLPDGSRVEITLQRLGTDWDLAYTEKQENSASAYVTAGVYESKMYVTDLGFEWLEFPKLIPYMKAQTQPHYIEAKASGKSAKQVLTNQGINAIEVNVDGGDKVARATMATPYAEAGRVFISEAVINKLLYAEKQGILKFPNNSNDDLQDALVQSINRLLNQPHVFTF